MNEKVQYYLNSNKSFQQVCNTFNISREEMINLLYNEGYYYVKDAKTIVKSAIIKYKEASEKFIKLGVSNTTFSKIAKEFGLNGQRFKIYLLKHYPNIKIYKDFYCNDNIFDIINTEEKAYWLGFIFADGYINSSPLDKNKSNDYAFELTLGIKDLKHLEKFKKFISFDKKISLSDNRCKIKISSKHLWKTLNSYGCTPRKSLTLRFPNENIFKNKDLIRHFIRGYFDGDGCITYQDNLHKYPELILLGTKDFLTNISEYFNISNSHIYNTNKKLNNTYSLNIYKKSDIIRISNFLYNNSTIYLTRKYTKYLEICRLYEESYRELETKIGEGCDANTEVNTEIKESVSP